MNYCKQTDGNLAALARYENEQAALDMSAREFEKAKVAALLAILKCDQSPSNDYTGLELIAESLSEHVGRDYRAICGLITEAVEGLDSIDDLRDNLDEAELGRLVFSLMAPYLEKVAYSHAERHAGDQ